MNDEEWFLIEAKNKSCEGYTPAKSEEEACEKLGLKLEDSFVKKVEWNGEEFVELNHLEQRKLL